MKLSAMETVLCLCAYLGLENVIVSKYGSSGTGFLPPSVCYGVLEQITLPQISSDTSSSSYCGKLGNEMLSGTSRGAAVSV